MTAPAPAQVRVVAAHEPPRLAAARALIVAYLAELGLDLAFQRVDLELADLAAEYAPPRGALLLAETVAAAAAAVGVVGVRPFGPAAAGDAELKRMYVAPAGRRLGTGRALAVAAITAARAAGHRRLLLDTLATMTPALTLYRSLGFTPIPAYRHNPFPDAVYLARSL